jgi:DNA topoisomerase-2
MAHKEYGLIPALIKIFDEILVNASDNRLRSPKTCTKLDVRIDPGAPDRDPCIRIWNNGRGIPIQVCFVEFANIILSDRQDKVPNLLI